MNISDARKYTALDTTSWPLWIIATLFYGYALLVENLPNTCAQQLMTQFTINRFEVSLFTTCNLVIYGLFEIFNGYWLDRVESHYVLATAAFLTGLNLILFANSSQVQVAIFFYALVGSTSNLGLIGAITLATRSFSLKQRAFLIGVTIMLGHLIGLFQSPLTFFMEAEGWRNTTVQLGIIGILIATVFTITQSSTHAENFQITTNQKLSLSSLIKLIRDPVNWALGCYGGLMFIPMEIFTALWGIEYFHAFYPTYTKAMLANLVACIFVGWMIGCPSWGWLSDYFQQRKYFLMVASGGLLSCLLILIYFSFISLGSMVILMSMLGFFSAGSTLYMSIAIRYNATNATGASLALINAIALIPIIISLPLFSKVLDIQLTPTTLLTRIDILMAFHTAWLMVGISATLAALLALLFIKEKNKI